MFAAYASVRQSATSSGSRLTEQKEAQNSVEATNDKEDKYSSFVGAKTTKNEIKKQKIDVPIDKNDVSVVSAAISNKRRFEAVPSTSLQNIKSEVVELSSSADESSESDMETEKKKRKRRRSNSSSSPENREKSKKRKHKKEKKKRHKKEKKRKRSTSREPDKKKKKADKEITAKKREYPQERWTFYNPRYKEAYFVYNLAPDHFNFTADQVGTSQRAKYNVRYAYILQGNSLLNKFFYPVQAARAERRSVRFFHSCSKLPLPTETLFRSHPNKQIPDFFALAQQPFDPRSEEEQNDETKARNEVEQLIKEAESKTDEEKEDLESKLSFEIRRRAKILATTRDPKNVNNWLERLKIEDEFYKRQVESGDKSYLLSTHNELKLDIIKHAIQKCPREVRLRLKKIEMLAENGTHADVVKEYAELIHTFPSNISAWAEYLDYVQFNKGAYTEDRLNRVFDECFARVQPIVDRLRKGEPRPGEEKLDVDELHRFLLDTYVRKLQWLYEMGKGHIATAHLQATLEFNLFEPEQSRLTSTNNEAILGNFGEYWTSAFPRIGDHGAIGWRVWQASRLEAMHVKAEDLEAYENGQEDEELVKLKKSINQSNDPDELCLIELERLLDRINLRPRRFEREEAGDNEDDFFSKPVTFEKLHIFMLPPNRQFQDAIYCLKAFGASLPDEPLTSASTYDAIREWRLDMSVYRSFAPFKLIRQICLFLSENEQDFERIKTIRYVYAINELRAQLWSSKSGFDASKSLRIFKKTLSQIQADISAFKRKHTELANQCVIAEMLIVFRALRAYCEDGKLDDELRDFVASAFAQIVAQRMAGTYGKQLQLAVLLELIKLQTSSDDIRILLTAFILKKSPNEVLVTDFPKGLSAWHTLKQACVLESEKQFHFLESSFALVTALEMIFIYYLDGTNKKALLHMHERHLQLPSHMPGEWPEERVRAAAECRDVMRTEEDKRLIMTTYLQLLRTHSETNGSFKRTLMEQLWTVLKESPLDRRLLENYIDLVLGMGGAKALGLKMKLSKLREAAVKIKQADRNYQRQVEVTYTLANIYLEKKKLEKLSTAGVSESTLARRYYEMLREEARRARDTTIWRMTLHEADAIKKEEAHILAASQCFWCRDLHLDRVALTPTLDIFTKTWMLMTEAGVPYYTDTDIIQIYKEAKM